MNTHVINNTIEHEVPQQMEFGAEAKALFGFWAYIMSDCLLFASIFASYAVLHTSTYGGPTSKELFNMPFVLVETLVLLTSSFFFVF